MSRIFSGKLSIYIVFALVSAFLTMEFVSIYKLSKRIDENTKMLNRIDSVFIFNGKLNLMVQKKVVFLNYDVLNYDAKKIKNILIDMKENSELVEYFKDEKSQKMFYKLNASFDKKLQSIKAFVAANAIVNSSFKNFIRVYNNLLKEDIKNADDLDVINQTYINLLHVMIEANPDIASFEKKLGLYIKSNANNTNMLSFFQYANVVVKYLKNIIDIQKENHKNKFENTLLTFEKDFVEYSSKVVSKMYMYIAVFCFLIVLLVALMGFLWKKLDEKSRELSKFHKAIQNSDNTIMITDERHKILYVNNTFERVIGYSKDEVLGQNPSMFQSGFHSKEFYKDLHEKLQSRQNWSGEFTNRRKDGKIIYEKASIYPITDSNGKLSGYLAVKLDITNEKNHLREIEAKSVEVLFRYQIDYKTGLWSKNILDDELSKESLGYLIYIKVGNFEEIRFFYGTLIANKIIEKVADRLKQFITTYSLNGQAFKLNDDDFCIWYKHKRPSEDMLKAIHSYFKFNPIELDGTLYIVELHMGVSESKNLPQGDRLLQGMIALQKAKKDGLPYVYYKLNNELEREYRQNIIVSQRIRNALNEELVFVHCQPIYNTQTQEIYSYEVLMRIYDENGRIMYPGEFLEIARQTALYSPLMHHVIALTFELLETYPDVKFSMNMSAVDILDKDTSTLFTTLLDSCEHPENLIIEVLESEGIENYDEIRPYLERARAKGCRVAIDDFGSGYSNYYRIMQLDVNHIKIDGSIIKELPYDKNARIVVETIIGFAKRKGWSLVAEFVSNEEIYAEVKKYGIEYTQGYYLGEPILLQC